MTSKRSRPTALDLVPFVRRFETSVPAVAKAITDRIWDEIPSYGANRDPSFRIDVEEAVRRNVAAFVRALGEGKDLSKRDIDSLALIGEQRANQGVPLEDVLRAFRMVGRVLWDHLSEQLEGPDRPPMAVAIELGGTLMKFTDQISSSVAHHYSVAQRSIVRQQEAARREFLHDLLLGSNASPDSMVQRARGFGYDLARAHACVVAVEETDAVDGAAQELALSHALDAISENLNLAGQPMVDRRGGQTIGIFSPAPGAKLDEEEVARALSGELGPKWRIGIGGAYPGLEGCRRSYLEASEAIEMGEILDPDSRVHPFGDFLLYRFLRADSGLVERFVDAVLGSIIEHDRRRRSELVKTLEAYFLTDGSAKEAGRKLFAHPHTVTYRLKQIERLTVRSLKDPEDKLHLHLAVKALRIMQGSAPESRRPALQRATS